MATHWKHSRNQKKENYETNTTIALQNNNQNYEEQTGNTMMTTMSPLKDLCNHKRNEHHTRDECGAIKCKP